MVKVVTIIIGFNPNLWYRYWENKLGKAVCGRLFDPRGPLGEGCLILENGIISKIKKLPPAGVEKLYNFNKEGLIITPAFIDIHVHLRGLELSHKEDEYTGTKAALLSGILAVMDMPNTIPRLDNVKALNEKIKKLNEKSVIDFGVYAAIPSNPREFYKILKEPIAGFKIYPSDIRNRNDMLKFMDNINKVIVLHPELPEALNPVMESEISRSLHRGCHLETVAVNYVRRILKNAKIHITHASCPSTIFEAKRLGLSVDVTPHHLLYDVQEGCLWRVSPPLRDRVLRETLMDILLFRDMIDALVSDHAPHRPSEKKDPLFCSSGFAWLEAWPWLIFRLVSIGVLSLSKFLKLLSLGPASILGLKEKIGLLKKGYRANIIVIDTKYIWRFYGSLSSKDPHLHLFMRELRGKPITAFLGGEEVLFNNECDCKKAIKTKTNLFKGFEESKQAKPRKTL